MAHICGCWQHRELDAIAAAENEEHHADFERLWCDAKAGKIAPVDPDHETAPRTRLALLAARDGWPLPVVRRIG